MPNHELQISGKSTTYVKQEQYALRIVYLKVRYGIMWTPQSQNKNILQWNSLLRYFATIRVVTATALWPLCLRDVARNDQCIFRWNVASQCHFPTKTHPVSKNNCADVVLILNQWQNEYLRVLFVPIFDEQKYALISVHGKSTCYRNSLYVNA
jgi:hypothetical protein